MAKRIASTKKQTTRRRRGVGSAKTGDTLMQVGFLLVGVAAGGILNKTVLAGKNPMLQALVPLAAGIAIPMFVKGDLAKFAGLGLAASGGTALLKKFNIAGMGDDSIDVPLTISGDGLSLIAGTTDEDLVMAGIGDNSLSLLAGLGDDDDD